MTASPTEGIRQALTGSARVTVENGALRPAGVMLVVYPKNGEYCVLLNKRTEMVEHHKGEISFPGGSKDREDESLLFTALRETHEEMGIVPGDVQVLGQLNDMPTISNFLISAFVGTIPYPYDFAPSRFEVAEVIEAPIRHLRCQRNRRDEIRIKDGKLENSPSFVYEGHVIFGATARVLANFLDVLGDWAA